MIRCHAVTKSYTLGTEKVEALRGVDLSIDTSGFYAIMGASGSGKSTLMYLLAGLDVPDSGDVSVAGIELAKLDDRALTAFRRRQVGIIFQQFNLIPTLTALENVELPAVLAGHSGAGRKGSEISNRAATLLESLGLGHRLTHRPDTLSGGEQQRVAIARSLLFEPKVILADEPTGNLDSTSSKKIWELLASVASQHGVTIVMVTHEPAAASHCAHVYVLKDGLLGGDFSTEGLDAGGVASRYQRIVA